MPRYPATDGRRGPGVPAGLRRPVTRVAATVLLGLVGWFAVELNGPRTGLAERVAAGAQALWPLAVVLTARGSDRIGAADHDESLVRWGRLRWR